MFEFIRKQFFIILFLFFSFTFPLQAETIQRKAYRVCQANEEAYWNGSSAECCDTRGGEYQLVKNYINSTGEIVYACCKIQADSTSSSDYQTVTFSQYSIAGAIDGSCCGGYTSQTVQSGGTTTNITFSNTIRQNGGIYYCANNSTKATPMSSDSYYYESDQKFCHKFVVEGQTIYYDCYCSTEGDPRYGSSC